MQGYSLVMESYEMMHVCDDCGRLRRGVGGVVGNDCEECGGRVRWGMVRGSRYCLVVWREF